MQATMVEPGVDYRQTERAWLDRNTSRNGVVRLPYGLDWIGRPYFDTSYPGVGEWARAEGAEMVLSPEPSGGRVAVEGAEIRIWR